MAPAKNQVPRSKNTKSKKVPAKPATGKSNFPIVGIGASAGGLEALELFLSNVPKESEMAFVIVQHLDPTHKGILVELLQRTTPMTVIQVRDRLTVKPNTVYVIPPNKDMSLLHGVLHLLEPIAPHGLRLPIDNFFYSLADDKQEQSIGVILSGMGSDGTLGIRAIKEKAGVVFVQEPATAKFDSMPRSAIETGLVDVIAPAEQIAAKICNYFLHVPLLAMPGHTDQFIAHNALEKVAILLRGQTGHDFTFYKKPTIYRRIERRMGLHQLDKISSYIHFLQENPQEVELLFRELLIGVTGFFRDPQVWDQLKAEVLPAIFEGRGHTQSIRIWVPACSTGEEAYSMAMVVKEYVEEIKEPKQYSIQIFATDLDHHAVEKAREGVYPPNSLADVSQQRLEKYFVKVERGYRVAKSIREMIIFAPQNIIMDPPFTKLDLLSCRNLLIYLMPELQKKLLPLFHYSLNPGGYLFLGSAETVGTFTNLFTPLHGKSRLYKRLDASPNKEQPEFPTNFVTTKTSMIEKPLKSTANLQTLADHLVLQQYAPAAVLTNDKGDILYTSGRTGKYLEPSAGRANWNVFVMAREGLRYGLTSAFQKSVNLKEVVTVKNLILGDERGKQMINVTIQPLQRKDALQGMVMIVFSEVQAKVQIKQKGKPGIDNARILELEEEVEHARQETQNIREEMQYSEEELKSINEELQSTNEELQSTNEELTTSKEELQSMNEELHTVNAELQTRMDELSRTNNDMKNLLDSTDIATLFLDNKLCVRRFTSETSKVTRLIPADIGRPITDIASALLYPELADEAHKVLRTLLRIERQIQLPDGNWFSACILPYRTLDNMIDGVVITFSDISEFKKLEAELRGVH